MPVPELSIPKPDLHGSINHVSITVSDLPEAMKFFGPMLKFLGYTVGGIFEDTRTGGRLTCGRERAARSGRRLLRRVRTGHA